MTAPDNTAPPRKCKKCGDKYPATLEYFHADKTVKCGLAARCKSCVNAATRKWKREHAKDMANNARRWREDNPDKVQRYLNDHRVTLLEQKKQWIKNNPDKNIASQNRYYKKNKLKLIPVIVARNRRWRAINLEKSRGYSRKWKRNNPNKVNDQSHRRRSAAEHLPCNFNSKDWLYSLNWWGNTCAYCGGPSPKLARDHFIPVRPAYQLTEANPGTVPWNIVPACQSCNQSKTNRDPIAWLTDKYGPAVAQQILDRITEFFQNVRHE